MLKRRKIYSSFPHGEIDLLTKQNLWDFLILYPYRSFQNTLRDTVIREFMLSQLSFIGSHNTLFSSFLSLGLIWDIPQCIHRDRKSKEKNKSLGYSLPVDSFRQTMSSSRFCFGEIQSTTTLQGMDDCWIIYFRMTTGLEIWQSLKWVIFSLKISASVLCVLYILVTNELSILGSVIKNSHNFSFQCLGRTNFQRWK